MAESQEPQGSEAQVSEAQIAVHWREEEYYPPPPKFVEQANANDPAIFERFTDDKFPDCFKEYADLLTWDQPWHTTLDSSNPPFWKWFVGGKLNASTSATSPRSPTPRSSTTSGTTCRARRSPGTTCRAT